MIAKRFCMCFSFTRELNIGTQLPGSEFVSEIAITRGRRSQMSAICAFTGGGVVCLFELRWRVVLEEIKQVEVEGERRGSSG
jgi:hypothetical protein